MSALEQYTSEVQDLFGLSCRFECDMPVLVDQEAVANHLYRIAQEAVNNAIKHGGGRDILVKLSAEGGNIALSIRDNGVGLPENVRASKGMGLHIMNYRAKTIGATLQVQRCPDGGTVVTCSLQ